MPARESTFKSKKCFDTHQEMTFYKATKECPKVLKSCLNSLLPFSVKAERYFSAAGLFISKLRSLLSDEMIDSLCFAHSYFLRK